MRWVTGRNKIAPTLEEAANRARNIAAPMNAARHQYRNASAFCTSILNLHRYQKRWSKVSSAAFVDDFFVFILYN
ncbi:MAG: LUD domain-containing protein [Anaerovibrio sp.]|nr:LUD domain-containing protein [Anaerovibrio sp.]